MSTFGTFGSYTSSEITANRKKRGKKEEAIHANATVAYEYETFSKGYQRITIGLFIRPGCSTVSSAPAFP